jgi:hypothetical protein
MPGLCPHAAYFGQALSSEIALASLAADAPEGCGHRLAFSFSGWRCHGRHQNTKCELPSSLTLSICFHWPQNIP